MNENKTTDRAEEIIGALAEIYGWTITTTDNLNLRAAFTGHTPTSISTIASQTAGPAKALTVEQFRQALTTTTADPGMPYHLPTCQCDGTGDIRGHHTDPNGKPQQGWVRCSGNNGRPITPDIWDRYQREHRTQPQPPATSRISARHKAAAKTGIAAARAQLNPGPKK